jgi:hypothetical protein
VHQQRTARRCAACAGQRSGQPQQLS